MEKKELLERISIDPDIRFGKPVIRGTRLAVQDILGWLAQGVTFEEILKEYYDLKREDIQACLLFAKEILDESLFYPPKASAA